MLTAARFLILLALGGWLGAAVFFSFIVAPGLFAVLPSRHLAGQVVAHVLPRFYLLSYACGALYLVGLLVEQRLTGGGLRALLWPAGLVVLMLVLIVVNHSFLSDRMTGLRADMKAAFGSVDNTPTDHPLRVRFNRYHGVSSSLLTADMLLALALLVLTVRRLG